jgi:hypothetical protein
MTRGVLVTKLETHMQLEELLTYGTLFLIGALLLHTIFTNSRISVGSYFRLFSSL